MIVIKTAIPDVLILEPKVFGDERGFFFESYNQQTFEELIGRKVTFVQDNHSKSKKNVLRGLHFQRGENAHPGFWQPMDTLRDKVYLEGLWEKGKAPWKTWE